MRGGLIFTSGLLLLALVSSHGLIGLIILLAVVGSLWGLYVVLRRYFRHLRELRYHAKITEPIILVAQWDGDSSLYQKAQHHEKYIRLSGNKNHVVGIDEQGNEIKQPIQVIPIYQHFPAENYGETWEEYQLRAREQRLRILREFHSYLYNKGRHEWYLDKVLKQKVK